MLMLLCAVTAWAQSSMHISEGLLDDFTNNQYNWKSGKLTAPDGEFNKLRVTFLQTSNNEKPAGFPCVAIAEFYLYDKDGNAVELTEANFSSNATQSDEGKISAICDGYTTQQEGVGQYDWYWHSQWSGTPSPYGYHYLEIDLTDVPDDVDLSEYSIGWVTRREQASPAEVVISTGATTEEAAQNYNNEFLASFLTTNEEAPVYFTIRNIRNGNYYATYTKDDGKLILNTTLSTASIFYITGSVTDGVATVKIHNYATSNCMAGFTSWTTEGIDWYIQLSENTDKPGFAISKENDLTSQSASWNNANNYNVDIANWDGNDVGSTFEFKKLSADEVTNIANNYVSDPSKFNSGDVYNFRSASGLIFINYNSNNPEKLTSNRQRSNTTEFVYYVSPNTKAKYLYNVAGGKFLGTTSTADADIPFSDTPATTGLTFKKSGIAHFPIMISTDGGKGALNYSGWYGKFLNWNGGFWDINSKDNSYYAEKVRTIDEETLATIQQLVGDYEFTIWKEQNLANLGRVGGYALDLQDEIEAITNYEQQVAFEAANEKIAINTDSYYRLVCVAPKTGNSGDVNYNTLTFNGAANLVTAPANASNINQIFKFEDAGNGYFYLKNMNADGYLNKIGVSNFRSAVVAQEEACKINVVSYADGYSNLAQHRLQNENTSLYSLFAENHPTEAIPYACSGWENGANSASAWYIVPATDIEVSINEFASIYLPFAVRVDGATAYAVEETNSTHAIFAEKADIPAYKGAILEGNGNGVATLTIISEATADWTNNMLKGSTVDEYLAGPAYVLANGEEGVGFYKAKLNKKEDGTDPAEGEAGTHFKNNANKAYLVVDGAEGAAYYSFRFPGTTGVEEITDNREQSTVIYDLTGRRVEAITAPGIYIVNGVKRVVR